MRKQCYLFALLCGSILTWTATVAHSQQVELSVLPTDTVTASTTSSRQILVCVQLAEISLSRMSKLGIGFAGFQENKLIELSGTEGLDFFRKLKNRSGQLDGLLDALVKNKIAHTHWPIHRS